MLVTYGNSRSINSRSKKVGTRSNEQDLVGYARIMRRTSASVHGVNATNERILTKNKNEANELFSTFPRNTGCFVEWVAIVY